MPDITNFSVAGNRVSFEIDKEEFVVKYPSEFTFGRQHRNLLKDIALCAWANKLAFTLDTHNKFCFDASPQQINFWKWIAQLVHTLDRYQSGDEPISDATQVTVETGGDPATLIQPKPLDKPEGGALICQSPGKESIATKAILEKNGVAPIYSLFYEYSSRAATHKIQGREDFEEFFDNPTIRVWSNTNSLQSTLQDYTDNYEPITCFWEWMYCTISVPLMAEIGLRWLLIGSQLDTGEAFRSENNGYVAVQEPNQSYIFEYAYSDYLTRVHDLSITQTSNVRPFTGYACRQIVAQEYPGWLPKMQNCLRPKPQRKWCLRCYKCNNAWVEFLACGMDPEEAGLSHDVLFENPHLGAEETEDWGFTFPRYERDELVWEVGGAKDFFEGYVKENLTDEQFDGFERWRRRQNDRLDEGVYIDLLQYFDSYVEPVEMVVPEQLRNDMGFPHTDFVPERMDPGIWGGLSAEWLTL